MASPNFAMFRVPSILQTSLHNLSRSSLEMDAKAPLLSDHGGDDQNEDFYNISRLQSLRSERTTISKQMTGELPIGRGCSFTQTIFNGSLCFLLYVLFEKVFCPYDESAINCKKQCSLMSFKISNSIHIYLFFVHVAVHSETGINVLAGVGLLSTPFTVKEAGWASLGVLVLFAIVCCYTATLMRYCFEKREGVITYPDIGEAAYGKFGRLFVSVSLLSRYTCFSHICY